MPSLVSIAEVRALVRSRLSDADLQVVIDREEAWLATKVGALTGERTETFSPGNGSLYVRRLTNSVVVTDNGTTVSSSDLLFTPSSGELRRVVGWVNDPPRHDLVAWQGDVTVTYTPADEAAVRRAIIELVRLTVSETGMQSETVGDYSYSRAIASGAYAGPSRAGLVQSILIRRPAYSMRLRSGWEPA